jgi:hypothetical protein
MKDNYTTPQSCLKGSRLSSERNNFTLRATFTSIYRLGRLSSLMISLVFFAQQAYAQCGVVQTAPYGPDPCDAKVYCSNNSGVELFLACTPAADTDGSGINREQPSVPGGSLIPQDPCYMAGHHVQWIKFATPAGINSIKIDVDNTDYWSLYWTLDPNECNLGNLNYLTCGNLAATNGFLTIVNNSPSIGPNTITYYYIGFYFQNTSNRNANFKSKDCAFICTPSITCPPPGSFACNNQAGINNWLNSAVVNSCGQNLSVTTNYNSNLFTGCNKTGTANITFTLRNAAGAVLGTCMQSLTITDNTPPVIVCPLNRTIFCTDPLDPTFTGKATATDNCTAMPAITFSDLSMSGDCPQELSILRIWTATDDCGLSASCQQSIRVVDKQGPSINCPSNLMVECGQPTAPVNTGIALASDNCDPNPTVTFSDVTSPGICNYTITRTWVASDECGNSSSCVQIITVADTQGPAVNCPPNATVQCDQPITPADTGTATATDNCDPNPNVAFTDQSTPGDCPQELTVLRTWIATDLCGNSSSCTQTINVVDDLPPLIICPPSLNVECGESLDPEDLGEATAVDNCGGVSIISFEDESLPGNCPEVLTIQRVWVATDECGNSSSCIQSISLLDEEEPEITCPSNVTVQCNQPTTPDFTGTATASDDCGLTPSITFTDLSNPGSCAQEQTILRTWIATDACGNTASCVQTINVVDTQAPVISCPPNLTVNCDEPILPPATGRATATDNCDANPDIAFSDQVIPGSCPQAYTINRTWTATDACGNSSTCTQVIQVVDKQAPSINCPPNVTVQCGQPTTPAATGTATATDNCDGNPSITFTDQTLAGNCAQEFTILRTWRATDACGNSSTCVQTINVVDTQAPVITCPANTTVQCGQSTLPAATGTATATDNCDGNPSVTYTDATTPGSCAQQFTILRTWRAVDACGNSTTCVQTINVVDTQAPAITCPTNRTVQCGQSTLPAATGTATATDNCDGNPSVTYTDVTIPGSCPQAFTIQRTWRATDDCGNSSTCVQTINVVDTQAPMITCPTNRTVQCGQSTLPAATGTATATDNCDGNPSVTYTDVTIPGSCPQAFTIQRTWRATDACGNSSTCVQTINVVDTQAPVITCPTNRTVQCGQSTLPAATGTATATDNCDGNPSVTYTDVTIPGNCAQAFTIQRTWLATDACGNSSTCVQTINVVDTQAPIINCPANATVQCGQSTLPAATGTATATDNCDPNPSVTYTDATAPGSCPQQFTILRTWKATDACGNSTTCVQTINVVDTQAPVITCPTNRTVQCGQSTLPAATGTATATDNCDPNPSVTYTDATAPGSCPQQFTILRTWKATDACGNSTTCVQTINVVDTQAPVITCPTNKTVQCGQSTLPAATGTATATDNCDPNPSVTYTDVTTAGNCAQQFTILRTWKATDACGNSTTCVQTINVVDTQAPVITCPTNKTVQCGQSTLPAATGTATATDNCDPNPSVTYTDVTTAGNCAQQYTILRTWKATDACGNSTTCVQTINVVDTQAPVITCPTNRTVQCGQSTLPAATGTATATDNCDPNPSVTYTDATAPGSCPQQFTILRTWKATDACGNSATCVQTINVVDTQAPVITCPTNRTVQCGQSTLPASTGTATATDNCDGNPNVTYTDVTIPGSCAQSFTIQRTWRATDACGNSSTCVQTINVVDTQAPMITCPTNRTVQCGQSTLPAATGTATATDNCDGNPSITYTDVTTAGSCAQAFTIQRTWRAIDACGNSSICVQTINVVDTQAPAITCPPNATVECTQPTSPELTGMATATDNCDPNPSVTFTNVTLPGTCPQQFNVQRTWKATDACGNSSTCIQTISVVDTRAPMGVCPPGLTGLTNLGSVPPPNPAAIAAGYTDNCGAVSAMLINTNTVISLCREFTVTYTYRISDECKNSVLCTVTHSGKEPTSISGNCPPSDTTLQCIANIPAFNPAALATHFTGGDGLAVTVTLLQTISDEESDCEFSRTYIYRVSDNCGNVRTCSITYSGGDTTPPTGICPGPFTGLASISEVPAPNTNWIAGIYTDNCSDSLVVRVLRVRRTGSTCEGIDVFHIYEIGDLCGNKDTCEVLYRVNPNPDGVLPGIIGECPAGQSNMQCWKDVPDPLDVLPLVEDSYSSADGGPVRVIYLGANIINNFCSFWIQHIYQIENPCAPGREICVITYEGNDLTPPTGECPEGLTDLDCIDDVPPADPIAISALYTDNCDGSFAYLVNTEIIGEGCLPFSVTYTYHVYDDCFNFAVCQVTHTGGNNPGAAPDSGHSLSVPTPGAITSAQADRQAIEVKIYPNPTSGEVYIEMSQGGEEAAQLVVYNIYGQQMINRRLPAETPVYRLDLAGEGFSSGTYLIAIRTQDGVITEKLILSRD